MVNVVEPNVVATEHSLITKLLRIFDRFRETMSHLWKRSHRQADNLGWEWKFDNT